MGSIPGRLLLGTDANIKSYIVNWRMDAADAANVQKQNLNVPACAVAVATVNVITPRMAAILNFVCVN
jgi:hypothetical protein